jgi:hypothetical protein
MQRYPNLDEFRFPSDADASAPAVQVEQVSLYEGRQICLQGEKPLEGLDLASHIFGTQTGDLITLVGIQSNEVDRRLASYINRYTLTSYTEDLKLARSSRVASESRPFETRFKDALHRSTSYTTVEDQLVTVSIGERTCYKTEADYCLSYRPGPIGYLCERCS